LYESEETMSSIPVSARSDVSTVQERDITFGRIIWRLIPFLTLIWFLAWVDRVNVGFAKLTMMSDLQWSDAVYGAGRHLLHRLFLL
jgi:hypothetical protein